MNALFFALVSVFAAVVCHGAVVRFLPRPLSLRSLLALVFLLPIAIGFLSPVFDGPLTFGDWLGGTLLAESLGLSYVLLFVGILYDSPTLALVNAIADCGDRGMTAQEIDHFISLNPFVSSRIAGLKEAKFLTLRGDYWFLEGNVGNRLLRLGEAYRWLCARQTKAG